VGFFLLVLQYSATVVLVLQDFPMAGLGSGLASPVLTAEDERRRMGAAQVSARALRLGVSPMSHRRWLPTCVCVRAVARGIGRLRLRLTTLEWLIGGRRWTTATPGFASALRDIGASWMEVAWLVSQADGLISGCPLTRIACRKVYIRICSQPLSYKLCG
jgi:hypothetical protein